VVKYLYNIAVYLLNVLLGIAAVFNNRARKIIQGRKNWDHHLKSAVEKHGQGMLWFHCASLGEFEQGRPVIEKIKSLYPGTKIMLTFFSASGYEVRKNYPQADVILYLPSDTVINARRFLQMAMPAMAVFVKYEFWYNFIDACKCNKVPIISISAVFRPSQIFFRPWGGFFRRNLKSFSHFFVQDQNSLLLLNKIGLSNVTVSGDTRFDRVNQLRNQQIEIPRASEFSKDSNVMILGSTWPSDIRIFKELINDLTIQLKFIIAPHHIHKKKLSRLERQLKVSYSRFSDPGELDGSRVLIIDNIGMLSSLYKYGKITYVGGAFAEGLHNIIEPAVYGLPVIFGDSSSNSKFMEVPGLINAGGGFAISSAIELRSIVLRLMNEPDFYRTAASASGNYVINNIGATDRIVSFIGKKLKN
jgi:3-deoxy-D-manno-octulosonic-acid transferase